MSMKKDLKDLEVENEELIKDIQKIKEQLIEIPRIVREEIQKQTPESIQSILEKKDEIEILYSKIDLTNDKISEHNYKANTCIEVLNENMQNSNNLITSIQSINEQAEISLKLIKDNEEITTEMLKKFKDIDEEVNIITTEMVEKRQKLEEIKTISENSENLKNKMDLIYSNIDKNYKEINTLHTKIFGYIKNEEDGTELKIKGQKDQLDESYLQLKASFENLEKEIKVSISNSNDKCAEVESKWETEHTSLKDKILALLPGALTTGLSYAYKEKKDSEINSMKEFNNSFNWAVLGLVTISIIPFGVSLNLLLNGMEIENVISKLPKLVTVILPLYIPILWIAYSSSKKINLSKRLIEEYSHKEALSKTFEGLSSQINNIKESTEKDELKAKLLYNLLEVSAENPGKLIYDYNNADHPLMDALDKSIKLSDTITRIANIPGMSKLSNILVEKEKKLKEETEEKISEGLVTVENTK